MDGKWLTHSHCTLTSSLPIQRWKQRQLSSVTLTVSVLGRAEPGLGGSYAMLCYLRKSSSQVPFILGKSEKDEEDSE